MKYLVLIGDGMSDLPIKSLGGKTPLQSAETPNMDFHAQNGTVGLVSNVPNGIPPGSDVAATSIFGYDPRKYYTGRGPLEAASLGVKLKKGDVAFRCNLVTIKDGKMESFTADHITTSEASKILKTLNSKIATKKIKFYTGLSYRHLLVISDPDIANVKCAPPHDITGKNIEEHLPKGHGEKLIRHLMKETIMPLLEHEVNIARIKTGKKPATMIWLWGQGKSPSFKKFKAKYRKSAAVITAVHLLKGLGRLLGMEIVNVKGATGFLDTNYKGKASAAIKMLRKHDVVFVHVEAPDECGHMGDIKGKIRAIEDFDSKIVGPLLEWVLKGKEPAKILVLPDHPTPLKLMTHTNDPVPFVIFDSKTKRGKAHAKAFSEFEAKKANISIKNGHSLIEKLLKKD